MALPPDPDFVLRGSQAALTCLTYFSINNQNNNLVSGNASGVIHTWCMRSHRPQCVTETHADSTVLSVDQLGVDGMVTHSRGVCVDVWKNPGAGWTRQDSLPCTSLSFCAAAVFRLNGAAVVAMPTHHQSQVDVVSMDTKETICTLTPRNTTAANDMCMQIRVLGGQRGHPTLLIGYESGTIALWDIRQAAELSRLQCCTDPVMSLDYSDTGDIGVSGSADAVLRTWRVDEQQCIGGMRDVEVKNAGVGCLKIRDDGKLFASGGWDSRLRLFSVKSLKPLAVLSQHTGTVQCLAFAADNTLAAGSSDCTISVWSMYK